MSLYILFNKTIDRYYIGITDNVEKRLKKHNSNCHQSYTGNVKGDWEVVFIRKFDTKYEAKQEETRLKKAKNRKYLEWYITHRAASSTGRANPS